jgi:hypothetical protein
VAVGATAVLFGLAVLWGLAVLTSRGDVELRGDDEFDAGRVDLLADAIEREGPIPFGDVAGGGRDVIVQHFGDDEESGWRAFDARAAGASRDCTVEWQPAERELVDPCSGRRYPADGEGLRQYPTRVADHHLYVDLRAD